VRLGGLKHRGWPRLQQPWFATSGSLAHMALTVVCVLMDTVIAYLHALLLVQNGVSSPSGSFQLGSALLAAAAAM